MSPTMIFRSEVEGGMEIDRPVLILGGSGGPKIISSVLQVFLNYCVIGLSLFDSITRPRVHDQLVYHGSAVTAVEQDRLDQGPLIAVSQLTKDALLRRGHNRLIAIDYAGTVQAVAFDLENRTWSAVSDVRKGGTPAGY